MRCTSVYVLLLIASVVCGGRTFAQVAEPDSGESHQVHALDRPPQPNFDHPVDYLAWYHGRVCKPDWPHGRDVYAAFYTDQAAELFRGVDDALQHELRLTSCRPWWSKDYPSVRKLIVLARPLLDALDRAASVSGLRWNGDCVLFRWGSGGPTPAYENLRVVVLARLASAMEQIAGTPFDAHALLHAWMSTFAAARHVRSAGGVLPFLSACSAETLTYENVRLAIQADALPGVVVDRLLESFPDDCRPDLADAFRFEWAMLLDLVQRLYPNGRFSANAATELIMPDDVPWRRYAVASAADTISRADAYFSQFVYAAERPWSLEAYAITERADEAFRDYLGLNVWMVFAPKLHSTYSLGMRIESERRATLLLLQALRYRQREGHWPETLDDFAKGTERIDPSFGKDFIYQVREGRPLLYAVGFDGEDNGGKRDDGWGEEKGGHDHVYFPLDD